MHYCHTTWPAHSLIIGQRTPLPRDVSRADGPQPDSTSCLNALYGFASSNADMDGIVVSVASEYLSLGLTPQTLIPKLT